MSESSNPHAYALLVGVGDYLDFDPTGASDLEGPVNDVRAWYETVRQAGVPAANVRICVAPGLSSGALGDGRGVTVTGATCAEIRAGLEWLVAALDGSAGSKALLTWSSHGTLSAEGAEVLCPSDVHADGKTLHNGISLREIGEVLDARRAGSRITTFIDACHTATGFVDGMGCRGLSWTGATARAPADAAGHRALGDLVLTSSEPGRPSHELPSVGGPVGAFSWAANAALRRWGLAAGVDGATAGLSFADLAKRTGAMLAALDVPQVPCYVGDPAGADERVFSGFGDARGSIEAPPLEPTEIWPETDGKVTIIDLEHGGSTLGTVYITGAGSYSGTGWVANRQYWSWDLDPSTNGGVKFDYHWPKDSFTSSVPVTQEANTVSVPSDRRVYERTTNVTSGTFALGSFSYTVATSSGTVGYLRVDVSDTSHVHVGSLTTLGAGGTILSGSDAATFTYQTSGGSVSCPTIVEDDVDVSLSNQ